MNQLGASSSKQLYYFTHGHIDNNNEHCKIVCTMCIDMSKWLTFVRNRIKRIVIVLFILTKIIIK